MEMDEELADDDADGKLHGDKLLMAGQLASALPSGAIQMGEVIE